MGHETWREVVFGLSWRQHHGSGLTCDVSTAMDLEVSDALWLLDRITEQRKRESDAIRKGSK